MGIRYDPRFLKSFEFIRKLLMPFKDFLFWIPPATPEFIDVDVVATQEVDSDFLGNPVPVEVITKVAIGATDITKLIANYGVSGLNQNGLTTTLASFIHAPKGIIKITSRIPLNKIAFPKELTRSEWEY